MPLESGTKLGPYEIQSPLGAGGMGEVYRARDTRLGRDVAIKILPTQVSKDPVRKQRFEREAKTISSLNHPHICVLHDIGSQDGVDYLVMECVEGETLAKRLEKGALPLEQVLKSGAQIADALDKAHRSGVVHRDLKPGNIMLTTTGAKLLDFGLAKPAADFASVATLSGTKADSPVTEQGTIVGTFQYMSPEQVEGKELDGRSDIFSLGAVLYEMLTGQRAFPGKSQLSVASAILEKEPAPISSIKPLTPRALDHAIRRCLAKDLEERWQTARDVALELKWIAESGSQAGVAAPSAQVGKLRPWLGWVVAAALTVALVVVDVGLWRGPTTEQRPVTRWTTVSPSSDRFPNVTLSQDGSHIAYIGRVEPSAPRRLYVRAVNQLEVKQISGSEGVDVYGSVFFSPDGNWIAYHSQGKLKKVPSTGGDSITICDAPAESGAWGPDGTIILGATLADLGGLSRVPAAGGKLEVLTTPNPKKGETAYGWPYFLPGGKVILFSIKTAGFWDDGRIAALDLRTGEQRVLFEGGSNPRYVPTGHLIYARGTSLFAVPFDPEHLSVKGTPSPVLEGVSRYAFNGFADYSFSDSGELVYVPSGAQAQKSAMVWVDRKGKAEPLEAPPQAYTNPSISPDGQRVAIGIEGRSPGDWDIWIYDLGRHTLTKVTYGYLNFAPVWSPDGRKVVFRNGDAAGKRGVSWVPADGSGPPERLFATDLPATPGNLLPDGSAFVFFQGAPGSGVDTRVFPVQASSTGGESKPRVILKDAVQPQLSPDGRWLAYALYAGEGGAQVYVQPFPSLVGKWQISTEGGNAPRWARSGRELFYRNGDKMMAVDIETKEGFRANTPTVLFEGSYSFSPAPLQPGFGYDVSTDGKRFLMIKPVSETNAPGQFQVVENWFEELKQRVPSGTK